MAHPVGPSPVFGTVYFCLRMKEVGNAWRSSTFIDSNGEDLLAGSLVSMRSLECMMSVFRIHEET